MFARDACICSLSLPVSLCVCLEHCSNIHCHGTVILCARATAAAQSFCLNLANGFACAARARALLHPIFSSHHTTPLSDWVLSQLLTRVNHHEQTIQPTAAARIFADVDSASARSNKSNRLDRSADSSSSRGVLAECINHEAALQSPPNGNTTTSVIFDIGVINGHSTSSGTLRLVPREPETIT